MTKTEILKIMQEQGFAFNKSLGQNFLIDRNILDIIVKTADCPRIAVEIGAGIGILTKELTKVSNKVITYEIDKGYAEYLEKEKSDNLEIINKDFLKDDIFARFGDDEVSIIANVPYYITTPIIERLFESDIKIKKIVMLVQKEVAERICGNEKSSFWHFVHYYSEPRIIKTVSRNCFYPSPNVDSSIIEFVPREPEVACDREKLFKIIRTGFLERRKKISNPLASILGLDKQKVEEKLVDLGYTKSARAEELTIHDFAELSYLL